MCPGTDIESFSLAYDLEFLGQQQAHIYSMSVQLLLQDLENNSHTQYLIRLITHQWQVTCHCSAVTNVLSTPCVADLTGKC